MDKKTLRTTAKIQQNWTVWREWWRSQLGSNPDELGKFVASVESDFKSIPDGENSKLVAGLALIALDQLALNAMESAEAEREEDRPA